MDELRRELGRRRAGPLRLPQKITIDLPVAVSESFAQAFQVRLVEGITATWELWFGLLQTFVQREGHARVPTNEAVDQWKLGSWVATQRRLFADEALLPDRRQRLESLAGWSWGPKAEQWGDGFAALKAFVEREGHAEVSKRQIESGLNLGTSVQHQRTDYRIGSLESERVALLETVPGWAWNTKDARWGEGYALLQQFTEREGHAQVA